jgi:type II secretory pathway component PulK
MNSKGTALTWVLTIIAIIAIIAGLYLYYQGNKEVESKQAELDGKDKELAN